MASSQYQRKGKRSRKAEHHISILLKLPPQTPHSSCQPHSQKKKDKQIKTVFGGDKKRGGGRQNRLSGTDKENHQVAFERATRTAEMKSVLRMQTIKTKTSTSMQMWRNVKTMKIKHCMWENVSVTPLEGRQRPSIGQQSCCSAHLKFHQKKRK